MKSFLLVCRGNICRSPMAAGFFLHQLKNNNFSISSAGTNALIDHPPDPQALSIMNQYGIDISTHRAQQLDDDLIRKFDLILVMTHSQLNTVTREFLFAKGKTFLLGHWGNFEIPDPYKKSRESFESVYKQIEIAWEGWKTRILACQNVPT